MTNTWHVLIPVKPLVRAKSRLDLPAHVRVRLALAMCLDVIAAASSATAVARVHVVSRDVRVRAAAVASGVGAMFVPGIHGLNEELVAAQALVGTRHRIMAVMADLPCLTSDVFSRVLDAAPDDRSSYLPDLAGQGTTMLMSGPSDWIAPRFGYRSAIAHAAIGHQLGGQWARAQCDVDTVDDLHSAQRIGVGVRTKAVLEATSALRAEANSGARSPSGDKRLRPSTRTLSAKKPVHSLTNLEGRGIAKEVHGLFIQDTPTKDPS